MLHFPLYYSCPMHHFQFLVMEREWCLLSVLSTLLYVFICVFLVEFLSLHSFTHLIIHSFIYTIFISLFICIVLATFTMMMMMMAIAIVIVMVLIFNRTKPNQTKQLQILMGCFADCPWMLVACLTGNSPCASVRGVQSET